MLKDYIRYVLGTIFLCTFLFVLFDFIHKTTKYFSDYQPKTEHLVQFYIYSLPTLLVQGLPIASLLASVICMVLFSRTNEITAMRAAGMGPLQIAAPIATGGILLSIISLLVGELVAPYAAKKMRYVAEVLIEGEPASDVSENARWLRSENFLYHFDEYDPISQRMSGVRIIETGSNFRPTQTTEGKVALYLESSKNWLLNDIIVTTFNPSGMITETAKVKSQLIQLPLEPKKLEKERRKPNELSLIELSDLIWRGRASGMDVQKYLLDMHFKFAFYFAAFVVSLIGLKFGYRSERTVETARGILLAISIGISYWFILSAAKAMGSQGTVPAWLAAWMANVIVFGITLFEIYRTKQRA